MSDKCPKCGSSQTKCVGWHAYQIAIDDSVEVGLMLCLACDHEWEE